MAISNMMKKLSMATAGAALMAMGVGTSAQAASFNFSYTLENGDILSGILEGDIQADGDTVFVSSVTNASYNGVAGPQLPFVQSLTQYWGIGSGSPFVSLSGNVMDIFASKESWGDDGFGFSTDQSIQSMPYLAGPSYGFTYEFYNPEKWQLTTSVPDSASVPEPASALGLLAFGALGAGSMLKRKQQQKATVKA